MKKAEVVGGMVALRPKAMRAEADLGRTPRGRADDQCTLYRAINGKPHENLIKVIELMGGIEKIIGSADVVVIKPNVQWWNQGAPNLSTVEAFVDLIMDRTGGFYGEVVLAENCHRGPKPWESMASG